MKFLNGLKYLIATAWFLFIYVIFYIINQYYPSALDAIWKFLFIAACGIPIFFIFKYFSKKFKAIHLRTVIVSVLLLPILLSSYDFFANQFSVVTGGSIVKQDSGVFFVPTGESFEGKTVLFEENLPLTKTNRILKELPDELHQYFKKVSFFKSIAFLEKNIFADFFAALLFFLFFSSFGSTVFFHGKKLEVKDRALSFFLGAGLTSAAIFLLGIFKIYSVSTFLIFLAVTTIISYKAIWDNLKFLWSQKVKLEKFDTKNLLILSGITILFAMLTLDFIRIVPLAWDDANLYMRGAKLFAQKNIFVEGIGPTAWILLQSIGWLFTETPQLSFTLLFTTFAVGIWIFYLIARKFLEERASLLATLFLTGIPLITFFLILDTKTEIPLLFAGAASIFSWLEWRESKDKKYLFISAALLGFATTIKITSIIFVITVFLATLYVETGFVFLTAALFFMILAIFAFADFMQTLNVFQINSVYSGYIFATIGLILFIFSIIKEKFWKSIPKFFAAIQMLFIVVIIVAPWSIFQVYSAGFMTFSNVIFGYKHPLDFSQIYYTSRDLCTSSDLSVQADYKRYTGYGNGLKALLLFPFYATMTFDLKTFISDITPIFLSILPFWLLFPKKIFSKNKKLLSLAIFTFIYVILWTFTSSGVMWYGIFMLIPGTILVFYTLGKNIYLSIFIGITIFANLLVRVNYFAEVYNLTYAFGIQSYQEIADVFYPGFTDVKNIIQEYVDKNGNAKIYRVGSQIKFFLPISDRNILDDDYLDAFTCILYGKTDEEIKKAFEGTGLTHVFINTNAGLGDVAYGDIYKSKIEKLKSFLQNSGWKLVYDAHYIKLYEIQ